MTARTATRIVLPFAYVDANNKDSVIYEIDPADDDGMEHLAVALTHEDYRDMGEPTCITVTIEPGDRLNTG